MNRKPSTLWRPLAALVLFGVSFGYLEAAVVVYLRELYEPLALELTLDRQPGELLPLITLEQLKDSDSRYLTLLKIEVAREAATIVMLACLGLAVGWSANTRFAAFIVAFGIWDIFYYVFLKLLIEWPSSLLDWDVLFLIPLPWVGPVLAPVLVAISMVISGTLLLWRDWAAGAIRISWRHWAIIVLGGLIIIVAFCWDYRNVMAGGMPASFPWSIFLAGESIGLGGYSLALASRYHAK